MTHPVREHAELIIEEAKRKQEEEERDSLNPCWYWYALGYEQGRKDAARVLLLALEDAEDGR
jgi:hypothetical protein